MKFSINQHIFNYITSSPNYIKTKTITLIYRSYNNDCLGFIVPKQLGPANKRNCFKRQCRGEFHKIYSDNNIESIGVVVRPKSININYHEISDIFKRLSSRLLKN